MNYALDVDQIIRTVLDGQGVRLALMLIPKHVGFKSAFKPIAQDLARTKQLLTEAGFPNGVDLVLNSPQGRYVRGGLSDRCDCPRPVKGRSESRLTD